MMSFIRRLAIRLNGDPQSALRDTPPTAETTPDRAARMPSSGGLNDPQFQYRSGSDLRASFGISMKKVDQQ